MQVSCFCFFKCFFSTLIVFQSFLCFSLDRTIWNKLHHYQFDSVCAPHTYSIGSWYWRSWELLAFEYAKNQCWQQNKFRRIKSMQHVSV